MGGLRLFAAVAVLLAASASPAAANDARVVSEERIAPRVVELTIATPAFAEPTKVHVDLPVGYDADPGRRWPVAYFLAGTMNTYRTFNTFVDGVGLTEKFPAIVVSPNGDSGYWSDWYNDGKRGAPMYETYVVDQLIPLIDAHFRTITERSARAVAGVSMGGYGSMMIAARHPHLFGAAATLSGAVDSGLTPNNAVLSISPTFQGGAVDAIYGPRATQEVRWRGHNPTDLIGNLRGMKLQLRSATGVPNPALGEDLLSADSVSCVVEAGVYAASRSMRRSLTAEDIPHEWRDYGPGCHTVPNFEREIADTLTGFTDAFARPAPTPASFSYESIEPEFDVWDWTIKADPARPLEFLHVDNARARGLTLTGSGTATVTTPPLFRGLRRVDLDGAAPAAASPDAQGRLRFTVDLGAPNAQQQYTPGATTRRTKRAVSFAPHAVVKVGAVSATRRSVRVCASALGGRVSARLSLRSTAGVPLTRTLKTTVTADSPCRTLRWKRRPTGRKVVVRVAGSDAFGHPVTNERTIRLASRSG